MPSPPDQRIRRLFRNIEGAFELSMKRQLTFCLALSAFLSLQGCSKTDKVDDTTGKAPDKVEEKAKDPSATTTDPKAATTEPPKAIADLPQIELAKKVIATGELGNEAVICYVEKQPITMANYRRQLKTNLRKFQDTMAQDPGVAKPYAAEARRRGIALTEDEKKRLLEAAKIARGSTPQKFAEFLKAGNMSEEQFNKLIMEEALADKMVRTLQNEGLLDSLVEQQLFLAEARSRGFSNQAFNQYIEIKNSAVYPQALKQSGLTADQYRDDIVNNLMVLLVQEKIVGNSPVTDKVAQDFYNVNKDKFKHGERVRLRQILIATPEEDSGPIEGLKSKIVRAKPDISPTELEKALKEKKAEAEAKGKEILEKALKGEDFATLANQYSDDVQARAAKTGGDTGFLDMEGLRPEIKAKIEKTEKGKVVDTLVENPIGWFIIQVSDRQAPGPISFAEVKPMIKEGLKEPNGKAALERWIDARRKAAKIVLSSTVVEKSKEATATKPASAAVN